MSNNNKNILSNQLKSRSKYSIIKNIQTIQNSPRKKTSSKKKAQCFSILSLLKTEYNSVKRKYQNMTNCEYYNKLLYKSQKLSQKIREIKQNNRFNLSFVKRNEYVK